MIDAHKIKICMIAPIGLPVPAIKGGAVETLITNLIDENETYKKMLIDVITIEDEIAIKENKKYVNTNFINVNFEKNFLMRIIRKLFKINKKFFDKFLNKLKNVIYNNEIKKVLKSNYYDFIITEGRRLYKL